MNIWFHIIIFMLGLGWFLTDIIDILKDYFNNKVNIICLWFYCTCYAGILLACIVIVADMMHKIFQCN